MMLGQGMHAMVPFAGLLWWLLTGGVIALAIVGVVGLFRRPNKS